MTERPRDLSTWTLERLEAHAKAAPARELEAIRELAQSRAYRTDRSKRLRLRWARLSLAANAALPGTSRWDRDRKAQHEFMLRAWVIRYVGPDGDPVFDPQCLAADTLAELTLHPARAYATALHFPHLDFDEIRDLRRHKHLTAHLVLLIAHVAPGPGRDRLAAWIEVREVLP